MTGLVGCVCWGFGGVGAGLGPEGVGWKGV